MKRVLVMSFISFFSHLALAKTDVITHVSPAWADDAGNGFAPELIAQLFQNDAPTIHLSVLPAKRASRSFQTDTSACYLGGSSVDFLTRFGIETLSSQPYAIDTLKVFSRKDELFQSWDALAGRTLAVSAGFEAILPEAYASTIKLEIVPTAINGFRMLQYGRVDGVIAFESTVSAMDEQWLSNPSWWIYRMSGQLNCRLSTENQMLVDYFNSALSHALRTGQLDDLYRRYHKFKPE